MNCVLPLLVMALSGALAAPSYDAVSTSLSDPEYTLGYNRGDMSENIFIPRKRAALVLDRLLIALQKALHEESVNQRLASDREGPRTAPLRLANFDTNDMTGLQRRGQGTTRGRVLRCYFNAITCF
ncbi:uncharacterized protein LOC125068389 [Vanessa atalanta]|uniref:uncharacterized protein LOC125068389 n=1 Tax=Vanessa atalanta TaxID=42275 RepID=UPI001FCDD664|nr:uncharacterized protein LOC125068389 [Vanessa atalanta]XP_047533444.1 uncharacterized protein LOC125068389 [Vanessa atalanta]